MRVILEAVVLVVLGTLALSVWIYSGGFDASAFRPEGGPASWLLETAKRQSVRVHAAPIAVPPLAEGAMVESGARLYHENCEGCHVAPGIDILAFARNLRPMPHGLDDTARRWNAAQLYWVVKNGIRWSAMPAAWGPLVEDEPAWSVVAFLQKLPDMPADRYQSLITPAAEIVPPPAAESVPPSEAQPQPPEQVQPEQPAQPEQVQPAPTQPTQPQPAQPAQ